MLSISPDFNARWSSSRVSYSRLSRSSPRAGSASSRTALLLLQKAGYIVLCILENKNIV